MPVYCLIAMRHGRYTVAIRTRTILEVKQLKQKAENVSRPVSPVIQAIPHNNDSPIPNIDDLDNLISETAASLSQQGEDNSALSPELASNMSIQSISSQSTDTSADFISSPTDFMTLSPQLDSFADSDMTSLFEDLSVPYMQSESQSMQIKLEDFADTLLDQPETSIDFLEDMTLTLEDQSPVVEETNISPGIKILNLESCVNEMK